MHIVSERMSDALLYHSLPHSLLRQIFHWHTCLSSAVLAHRHVHHAQLSAWRLGSRPSPHVCIVTAFIHRVILSAPELCSQSVLLTVIKVFMVEKN